MSLDSVREFLKDIAVYVEGNGYRHVLDERFGVDGHNQSEKRYIQREFSDGELMVVLSYRGGVRETPSETSLDIFFEDKREEEFCFIKESGLTGNFLFVVANSNDGAVLHSPSMNNAPLATLEYRNHLFNVHELSERYLKKVRGLLYSEHV